MSRIRFLISFAGFLLLLLLLSPAALAAGNFGTQGGGGGANGGQGFYGESTDKAITNVMFATIAFFPTVILIFSLIQWRLDKRKHDRMDAMKRRAANVDWRGGW